MPEELKPLSAPHKTLTNVVRATSNALIDRIQSGSRDYDEMRRLLEDLISYQHGADVVSGQVKP